MSRLFFIIIIGMALGMGGCTDVRGTQLKADKSKEDYRNCLLNNPSKPKNCEYLKSVYELDQGSFNAAVQGHILHSIGEGLQRNAYQQQAYQANAFQEASRPHIWLMNQGGKTYSCNDMVGGMVNCNP